MTDQDASQYVVSQCAQLTLHQIVTLGKESDGATGYFGRRSGFRDAYSAARKAAQGSGRSSKLEKVVAEAEGAIFKAVVTGVAMEGRSTKGIAEGYLAYRQAAESGNRRSRERMFRAMQRVLSRRVGLRLQKGIAGAITGASGCVAAVLTWDLAAPSGPYTPAQRDVLVAPWLTIGSLPPLDN